MNITLHTLTSGMVRMLAMLVLVTVLHGGDASAQTPPASPPAAAAGNAESEVCTNFAQRAQKMKDQKAAECKPGQVCNQDGLLTEIYNYIKEIVEDATQKLFVAFTSSDAYQAAVGGAMVLMIAIFGVAFTIGVVQASFGQALIRMVKLGVVFSLISPGGWEFFNDTMVKFFTEGVDELIVGVNAIGTGMEAPEGASPFYQLDALAEFIINPEILVKIVGAFTTGPFGMMMGGLMSIAAWGFVLLLVRALRTYAVSYVARTLLLGLAPVFFVFLLFERTKQLFMSWLNALITLSLQPILMFTFLAFFMVMLESATRDMLGTELCWTDCKFTEGANEPVKCWQFVDPKSGKPYAQDFTWQGPLDCALKGDKDCKEFPINVLDVLSFLILIYLCIRFVDSIERIANELGGAFISLDTGGRLDQFMREQGNQAVSGVNPSKARTGSS